MYIIIASLLTIVAICFGSTIFNVITSMSSNSNNKIIIGNIWFIGLLIINIILIIFTCMFYYYTSQSVGLKGNAGKRGFDGQQGDENYINPNSNQICK